MTEEKIARWFDKRSRGFDALYTGKRHPFLVVMDRIFRKNIPERFYRTGQVLSPLEGKRILDVGCGSGQYAVSFALSGAREVVGIDVSPVMLDMARRLAVEKGVSESCRFIDGEIMQSRIEGPFDHAIAIGFFDYNVDGVKVLQKMANLTEGKVVATFPMLLAPRVPARKLWLALKRCPVYFYTRSRIEELFSAAGMPNPSIDRFHALYFAVGNANASER